MYGITVVCANWLFTLGRLGVHFSMSVTRKLNAELRKGSIVAMLRRFC